MEFSLKSCDMNTLVDFGNTIIDQKSPHESFHYAKCTINSGTMTVEMYDSYKAAKIQIPLLYGEDGGFMLKLPTKKFKKTDNAIIVVNVSDESVTYTTDECKIELKNTSDAPGIDLSSLYQSSNIKFEIYFNPRLLSDVLKNFDGTKSVKLSFKDDKSPVNIKQDDKEALVCPKNK